MSVPELEVNGTKYGAWTSVQVTRSLDSFAASWSVQYTDKWAPNSDPWAILPGDTAKVVLGDKTLATGFVNVASWQAGSEYRVTAEGRSATGDMVDAAPFADISDQATRLTLGALAKALAAPFGIEVVDESGDTRPLEKFTIDLGESAFDALDRACRSRGVLPSTTPEGAILLSKAGALFRSVSIDPLRIARRGLSLDESQRFSDYYVYGQHPAEETFRGDKVVSQAGHAPDQSVARYRPHVTVTDAPSTGDDLQREAAWIRNVRAGRSEVVRYRIAGPLAPDGGVWEPGMLCKVEDKILRVFASLILQTVVLTWDANGQWADLTLTRPEAYSPDPFPERTSRGEW